MLEELMQRANGRCEICGTQTTLDVFVVAHGRAGIDPHVLLCETCRTGLAEPSALDEKYWFCLRDSMWSEHAPVKVLSYRILKKLGARPLAQELLGQIYLDEDQQAWADAGLSDNHDDGPTRPVDSNGTALADGDTVTLIKDLDVKGGGFTAKRGTTVKGISLTDDAKYVEGKVNGMRIVLVAAYLKKA